MLAVCPVLLLLLVLVACPFDAWLACFVASGGGSLLLSSCVCCVSSVVVASGLLLVCFLCSSGAGCVSSVVAFACPCCSPCVLFVAAWFVWFVASGLWTFF